jgi:tetratricopeptide (TPR) repeat protein
MAGIRARARRGLPIRPDALRDARCKNGLTLAQLADGIVSKQALQGWEAGLTRPTRDHLLAIAGRLDVPLQSLLADARDAREDEMARLEEHRRYGELEELASQVLADRNVSLRTHALAHYYRGRATLEPSPQRAVTDLGKARRKLAKAGMASLAAEAADWETLGLYYMQDPRALEAGRRIIALYRELEDRKPAVEARMLEHLGTYLLHAGENGAAIASYHEALDVAGSLLDLNRLAIIYHGLATGYARIGEGRQGLDYMERSVVLHRCLDDVHGTVSARRARAENTFGYQLLRIGGWERAESMIQAALDHFQEAGVESGRADALLSMGELRQLQGRLGEAMDWTAQAIDLAERLEAGLATAQGYQQLGELFQLQGEPDRMDAAFTRALEVLEAARLPERRREALARFERLHRLGAEGSQRA